jgi:folate-binding protein YgfZ
MILIDNPELDHLLLSGGQAERFLQGQTTINTAWLDAGEVRPGAFCDPRGRIQVTFLAWRTEEKFHLLLPKGMAAQLQTLVQKYLPFYRSTLETSQFEKCALIADRDQVPFPAEVGKMTIEPSLEAIRLPGGGFRCLVYGEQSKIHELKKNIPNITPGTWRDWQLSCIMAGMAQVSAINSGRYLPQHLNYPSIGGVSFKKGCYTGQEVIARLQNLGQVKKRLFIFEHFSDAPLKAGGRIESACGKLSGDIVECCFCEKAHQMGLAVFNISEALQYMHEKEKNCATGLRVSDVPYRIDQRKDRQQ